MPDSWFDITIQRGVVRVYHERSARDATEAEQVVGAIDATLQGTGIERVLFDSRDADRTPPEAAAVIWSWLQRRVDIRKVATLMHSRPLSRNMRRVGAESGVRIRTFADERDARRWLDER